MSAPTLTLRFHICAERRDTAPVRLYGDDATVDATAAAFAKARGSYAIVTPVVESEEEEIAVWQRFPLLDAVINPVCPHGMSARSCSGPNHWGYDDEEWALGRAVGW